MIGAATSAPPAPPAPASAGNSARAGMSDSNATGAATNGANAGAQDAAKSDGGKETAAVKSSAKRDTADGPAREAEPASDFADLLAASSEAPAAASSPAPSEVVCAEPAATSGAGTNAALPDQLLALLSGSWASTATASSPAAATPAAATPAADPTASRSTPMPTTATAAMPYAFSASPTTAAAADTGGALPALAELAGAALGNGDGDLAANAADAPSFDNTLFAAMAPTPAPLRANATTTVPGPPLTMPDNPDAGFDDGIGARIAWMAEQRVGHAEIRLNPEHVGPIDVRVQLDGTRVSAEFHSAHADVRQAIEASVPRLREMLGQQGLQLGHADVGRGHSGQGQRAAPSGRDNEPDAAGMRPSVVAAPVVRSRGLLDEYA